MKKIILLYLVFAMVLSLGTFSATALDVVLISVEKELYTKSNSTYIQIDDKTVVSQYFKSEKPINGFGIKCPSFENSIGGMTLRIYRWSNDIPTTLSTEPIAAERFENFADNTWLDVKFAQQPAGEYLITASEGTEKVAVWILTDGDDYAPTYKNGELVQNFHLQSRIFQISDPELGKNPYEGKIDAYSKIEAYKYTAGLGFTNGKIEITKGKKEPAIAEVKAGGYALYKDVDFGDDGAQGIKMFVNAGALPDIAQYKVVLDDLTEGETIADVVAECYYETAVWETVPAKLTKKVTGVHDVYVVFKYDGGMFANMVFTKDDPGKSRVEERLENFVPSKEEQIVDDYHDTWTATDAIGRTLGSNADYGDFKPEKQALMFYWTWQVNQNSIKSSVNVNELVKKYPQIKNNYSDPIWEKHATNFGYGIPWHWNESLYGYYTGYDEWVMRKNMEMLTAAGVDAVVLDCSNGNRTFTPGYMRLGKVINEMRLDGIKAPQMSFIFPWESSRQSMESMERVYENMYSVGLYSDAWYYVNGKPLLMGQPYSLGIKTGNKEVDDRRSAMLEFFTFKENHATYNDGPESDNEWPWLSIAPQPGFGKGSKGTNPEIVAVSPAQNWSEESGLTAMSSHENVFGRSYTYNSKFSKLAEYSAAYGYNFQEQWDNAIKMDPDYVFITGWNEQIAIRQPKSGNVNNALYDLFNDEYSRDLEPTKSYMGDNYYYQLVDNMRRFKGVRKTPLASETKTINMDGGFQQWTDVGPEFIAYKNNVQHRNVLEYGYERTYVNNSGRNDIVLAKVARDTDKIYFYVETLNNLTPSTDSNWMRLFINSDRDYSTGWLGYDYIINRRNPDGNTAYIEKYADDFIWEAAGTAQLKVEGNKLMISADRNLLGIGDKVDIEFKWADNNYSTTDANDFYVNGDVAPLGRFNYHYTEVADKKKKQTLLPVMETPHQRLRNAVVMKIDSPKALAKSTMVLIDPANENITPKVINDRTLLPVRFLAESIEGSVSWSEVSQTATISRYGTVIKITVGSDTLKINASETVKIDVPAQTIDDRIYVPMRAICEALGLEVYWDERGIVVAGDGILGMCASGGFMDSLANIAEEF